MKEVIIIALIILCGILGYMYHTNKVKLIQCENKEAIIETEFIHDSIETIKYITKIKTVYEEGYQQAEDFENLPSDQQSTYVDSLLQSTGFNFSRIKYDSIPAD